MFNFKTKIILQLASGHLPNPQQAIPISERLAVGHLVTVPMPSQMERDVTLSFAVLEAIFSLQVTYFLKHLTGKNFKVKSKYLILAYILNSKAVRQFLQLPYCLLDNLFDFRRTKSF